MTLALRFSQSIVSLFVIVQKLKPKDKKMKEKGGHSSEHHPRLLIVEIFKQSNLKRWGVQYNLRT